MLDNQKKFGVILSYCTEGVKIITTLVYTPFLLRILNQNEYGLYQLVASVVAYLSLFSLGFGSSYLRFYSTEKINPKKNAVERLNGMYLMVFLMLGTICFGCGMILLENIHLVFGNGLNKSELLLAKKMFMIMLINLVITFPNSVFDCIITAKEKFVFQKLISLISAILNPIVSIIVLFLGFGTVGLCMISLAVNVLTLLVNMYYCQYVLKIKFLFDKINYSLLSDIFAFTFFIFINQIINQINWNVDKLLLGRFIGTSAVAIYGVASQLISLINQSSRVISTVFLPQVNSIVIQYDDTNKLNDVFIMVGRIQFFVLSLVVSGVVFFGQKFIILWAGESYEEAYYVVLLLSISSLIPLVQTLGIEIQRAMNKHRARSIVYLCISIINVIISIPLIKLFGVVGAATGTAIAFILANTIFMNWYYHNKIGLDIPLFWKNIASMCKGLVVPFGSGCILMFVFPIDSFLSFSFVITIYIMIYIISMYIWGLNTEEKNLLNFKRK